MIFWRMKELLEGSGELLRAEAELASMRFRRMLVGSVLVLLGGTIALAGLASVAAGIAVEIAGRLGWSAALVIVGGGVTLLCLIGWLIAATAGGRSPESIEEQIFPETNSAKAEARQAKARMADAATPGPTTVPPPGGESVIHEQVEEIKNHAVRFASHNPLLVGSGALLVLSVIGPSRTLRMISRAAAAAGVVGTIIEMLGDDRPAPSKPRTAPVNPPQHPPVRSAHDQATAPPPPPGSPSTKPPRRSSSAPAAPPQVKPAPRAAAAF